MFLDARDEVHSSRWLSIFQLGEVTEPMLVAGKNHFLLFFQIILM